MKVTWLDLYNFLYYKAHDFNNLGSFDWNAAIKVIDPETGKEYSVEPVLQRNQVELFCNPSLIIKIND